jgi:hypothetical protein
MVTTKIIIEKMNNMMATTTVEETELAEAPEVAAIRPRAPVIVMRPTVTDETEMDIAPAEQNLTETATEQAASTETTNSEPVEDSEPVEETEPVEATEQTEVVEATESIEELRPITEVSVRRSERIARGVSQPERYLLLTKIQNVLETLATNKEQAKFDAIQKEIVQLFEELRAVALVMKADVPKDAEVLRCFIFSSKNFLRTENSTRLKHL